MARGSRAQIPIGTEVERIRKDQGLSLNEAAERCQIGKATLLRLERNERDSQLTTLVGVSAGLGIIFSIEPDGEGGADVFIDDGKPE